MPATYEEFLDATIQHLQNLKAHGTRFVEVTPETFQALTHATGGRPAVRPTAAASAKPAPPLRAPAPAPIVSFPDPAPEPLPVSTESTATPPALDPVSKAKAMDELRGRALACMKCPHLVSTRKNVVFGVGDIQASILFVGEAPGADEDVAGEPFVGPAGQLLTRMIQAMGTTREQVYIANILKCRPDTPGQSFGNRKPTPEEMRTCIPYLHSQIELIQPKVMIALGGTAMEGLLGKTAPIGRLRGNWHTYRGIPLMPTFHPSYLLRTTNATAEKRKVWEDMLQVLEKLGLPISEKQRRFFQTP